MKAKVYITLKNGVLDPQGKAVAGALANLGFSEVADVRQGKFVEIELRERDKEKASANVKQMCEKLLANTVIENYQFDLVD
jgi:phosphoribosylformylglycinamidine synthase